MSEGGIQEKGGKLAGVRGLQRRACGQDSGCHFLEGVEVPVNALPSHASLYKAIEHICRVSSPRRLLGREGE